MILNCCILLCTYHIKPCSAPYACFHTVLVPKSGLLSSMIAADQHAMVCG